MPDDSTDPGATDSASLNMTMRFEDIATPDPDWPVNAATDLSGQGGAEVPLPNVRADVLGLPPNGTLPSQPGQIGTPDSNWYPQLA